MPSRDTEAQAHLDKRKADALRETDSTQLKQRHREESELSTREQLGQKRSLQDVACGSCTMNCLSYSVGILPES